MSYAIEQTPCGMDRRPSNKDKKMSKVNDSDATSAASGRKGREWSAKFSRTVKFYDGTTFEFREEKVEGELPLVATDLETAYNKLGLSPKEVIQALNTTAKNKLIEQMSEEKMGADAIPEAVLLTFLAPYKSIPSIAALKGKNDAETKALQNAAAIEKVKTDPDMIAALKAEVAEAKGDAATEGDAA